MTRLLHDLLADRWLFALALLAFAVLGGLLLHGLVFSLLRRVAQHTRTEIDNALVQRCRAPSRLLLPLALVVVAMPALRLEGRSEQLLRHGAGLLIIAGVAWLLMRVLQVASSALEQRIAHEDGDDQHQRKARTQLRVLRRIASGVIVLIAIAAMLMTFERVRQLGASLLASAGIAGIVLGVAAQRTLANLVAGVQIAISQPIRIDDVVIVEGEWGRIEEITLTYVVVRIWDLRRLVVPITYFVEKPFENWTRVAPNLLGTVYFHVDYSVPIDELRAQLHRILEASQHWDGEAWSLLVTGAGERTVQVRAMVSAADASATWSLRCEVREQLIAWLQHHHPGALPRLRAEVDQQPSARPAA